jgi:hypothetical protein
MKTSSTYATIAAAVLVLAGAGYTYAGNGGQGQNNGGGQGQNNCGQTQGNCNQGQNNNNQQIRLRTNLTAGSATSGKRPQGTADFRFQNGRTRLEVDVQDVNQPAGTVLTVTVIHAGVSTIAGTITVGKGGSDNDLELDSQNGDLVPTVVSGDMVTVSQGTAVILAGVF